MEHTNAMTEDWDLLLSLLPAEWQSLGTEQQAFKGLRKAKGAAELLRTLLLHTGCGYSLRETVVRAREAQLGDLSDVALLKRLRKSAGWLQALCLRLLPVEALPATASTPGLGLLRLIDSTVVQEPGATGSSWKLHYSLRWPQLTCDHFRLTPAQGVGTGDTLVPIPVQPGEHLLADRGYSNYASVQHVQQQGGWLTVRLNPSAVRLLRAQGAQRFTLRAHLQRLARPQALGCWSVQLTNAKNEHPVKGRLCVLRKSAAATARCRAKLQTRASRNGTQLQPETLYYAQYVLVFTTAPATLSGRQILQLYRLRWQIELVFKRFKQLAQLGHLPKYDEESSKAWLYGKLLVALLTERLLHQADAVSPWGYDAAPEAATPPQSLA